MKDITIIVELRHATDASLTWIDTLANDPKLAALSKVLVCNDETQHLRQRAEELLRPQASFVVPRPTNSHNPHEVAQQHAQVIESVQTRYFTVLGAPRETPTHRECLPNAISRARDRLAGLDLPMEIPIFAYVPGARAVWGRSYIYLQLKRQEFPPGPLADHLGYVALLCGSHSLEAADPNSGIALQARSSLGRFNLATPPPWKFEIALYDRSGALVTSAECHYAKRIDSVGRRRWESLRASLALTGVESGDYRVRIRLKTRIEGFAISYALRPTPGLLASARTRALQHNGNRTFFLLHTVGTGRQTWLTLHCGTTGAVQRQWERGLIRKDVRTILKDRAAGRMRFYRFLRLLTAPLMRRKAIWLIGERADTAQDNGYHLFRHIRQNHPDQPVYYIIERNSPHWARLSQFGNVLPHSSFRHRFLMLHAHVIANAYSIQHMTPHSWTQAAYTRYLAWRVGAMRVYLKHGIHLSTNLVKRGTGGYDLYLTAVPQETEAFRATSGYDRELVECGMPRYDSLTSQPASRTILFMPTWRRYLVPRLFGTTDSSLVPYAGSTYEEFLNSFLGSKRLRSLLEDHDYRLLFLPHYNMRNETRSLPLQHDRVIIADTTVTPFQQLLTTCDIFITDYSSVQFDVAYIGTPIIYAHFDREEFELGHNAESWFDYQRDAFGEITFTVEETLDRIEELMGNGGARPEKYTKRAEKMFAQVDQNNSARVVDAISGLLSEYRFEISGR